MKHLLSIFLVFPLLLSSHTIRGKVVKVQDGDTVTIVDSTNTQYKIRLDEIDAPESGQAFGSKSKQFLSDMIFGKTVIVEYSKTDRYKRILGTIYHNDMNVNEKMVGSGYAWKYYYNKSKHLQKIQEEAKLNKRGLWVDKNPIDPYHFRKSKNKQSQLKHINNMLK